MAPNASETHSRHGLAGGWLGLPMCADLLFWLPTVAVLQWVLALFYAKTSIGSSPGETWILISSTSYVLVIVMTFLLLEGAAELRRWHVCQTILHALSVCVPIAYLADYVVFCQAGVHIASGIHLLAASGVRGLADVAVVLGDRESTLRLCLLLLVAAPVVGVVLRPRTASASRRLLPPIRIGGAVSVALLALVAVSVQQATSRLAVGGTALRQASRIMPLLASPRERGPALLTVRAALRPPRTARVAMRAKPPGLSGGALPNIYFFIVETLRRDFVNPETAPNLSALARESIPIATSLPAANATQLSWFSILTGRSPLQFHLFRQNRALWGSPVIRRFRSLGYRVEVLSSSCLDYYEDDQIAFGANHRMADLFIDPRYDSQRDHPARLDQVTAGRFVRLEDAPHSGQPVLRFVFLQSTHRCYSWPKTFRPRFVPFCPPPSPLLPPGKSDMPLLRNRYRNAIAFIDSLLGRMFAKLRAAGHWDNSFIVVVGDHGEEFLERGHLFHGSALDRMQTSVPILIRPPHGAGAATTINLTSHRRLLAGLEYCVRALLLHKRLSGSDITHAFEERSALVAAANGGLTPRRFYITDGRLKALFQYASADGDPYFERTLDLTDIRDMNDRTVLRNDRARQAARYLHGVFRPGLKRVFSGTGL